MDLKSTCNLQKMHSMEAQRAPELFIVWYKLCPPCAPCLRGSSSPFERTLVSKLLRPGRQHIRDASKIGMIADVVKRMLPDDGSFLDQEQPGHHPRIADGPAAGIAFQRRAHTACHHFGGEHFTYAAAFNLKGVVELAWKIGDCTSLRPELAKERIAVCNCSLVEEEDGWIGGIGSCNLAQVSDGLAAEDSTKVPQKDQQCWRCVKLVAQRAGFQVETCDGHGEDMWADCLHTGMGPPS